MDRMTSNDRMDNQEKVPHNPLLNPYASPDIKPLRGYWARFFPAIVRAFRRYRYEMRRGKMGLFAQFRAFSIPS